MTKYKKGQEFIIKSTGKKATITQAFYSHRMMNTYHVLYEDQLNNVFWIEADIDKHVKAGTWILPIGYQTPLWKVLNGEEIE